MKKIIKKNFSLLTFLFIPFLFFGNPKFLTLMGVEPYWAILWLFPWSYINGPLNGFLTGLALGIVLDSLNSDFYTHIPGLVACGILFGRLSNYKFESINIFKYGLFCALGSLICNFLYWGQIFFNNYSDMNILLVSHGIKTIFAQVFITGILAPIVCTWLFNIFKKK